MKLLGDWNWYLPRWLDWLPRLNAGAGRIAGSGMSGRRDDPAWELTMMYWGRGSYYEAMSSRSCSERLQPARRVLVVDDHASFRRCASELLSSEGYDVVGEAADGASALALAAS